MTIVAKIESVSQRLERAREIVENGALWPIHKDEQRRYVAKSHSGQHDKDGLPKLYLVGPESCTCADYRRLAQHNGGWCKHRLARELLLNEQAEGREKTTGETPAPDEASVAPRPSSNKERYELAQAAADAEVRGAKELGGV